jgi:hypothetical protein
VKKEYIREILLKFKEKKIGLNEAIDRLSYQELLNKDFIFARVDHSRRIRCGFPEVVFGINKKPEEILKIANSFLEKDEKVLITKVNSEVYEYIKRFHKEATYHKEASIITISKKKITKNALSSLLLLIITAGTSDIPIAEESYITAKFCGVRAERLYDIGVAGIHRLLDKEEIIRSSSVIIVVAGMEGALASVISGLVDIPVIAVPTSTGYGASFQGLSALLTMLNSCAPGVVVVNIDNGFGAGYFGAMLIKMLSEKRG